MPLIDMDTLWQCETCFHHKSYGCNTWCDAGEAYRPAASKLKVIDAVEVVRCGECIHRGKDSWCAYVDDDPDFFCKRGRRAENAAD